MKCQACDIRFEDGELTIQIVATTVADVKKRILLFAESAENVILHLACYHKMIDAARKGVAVKSATTKVGKPKTSGAIEYNIAEPVEEEKDALHKNASFERNDILSFLD